MIEHQKQQIPHLCETCKRLEGDHWMSLMPGPKQLLARMKAPIFELRSNGNTHERISIVCIVHAHSFLGFLDSKKSDGTESTAVLYAWMCCSHVKYRPHRLFAREHLPMKSFSMKASSTSTSSHGSIPPPFVFFTLW